MYIPDHDIDEIPTDRLIRSMARRLTGRKRSLPDGVRFVVQPPTDGGITVVRDRKLGDSIRLETPTDLDRYTVQEVFLERAYSLQGFKRHVEIMDWVQSRTAIAPALIIDGGANIGASSLLFSRVFPGSIVVAVEPDPRNSLIHARNCGTTKAIRLVEAAIGPFNSYAMLSCGENPRGRHLSESGTTRVRVLTVESLLEIVPTAVPFLLKLDIEGAEEQLFATEAGWIDLFPIIVIEPHDWKYPKSAKIRGFLKRIANRDRDLLVAGENLVSISNTLSN